MSRRENTNKSKQRECLFSWHLTPFFCIDSPPSLVAYPSGQLSSSQTQVCVWFLARFTFQDHFCYTVCFQGHKHPLKLHLVSNISKRKMFHMNNTDTQSMSSTSIMIREILLLSIIFLSKGRVHIKLVHDWSKIRIMFVLNNQPLIEFQLWPWLHIYQAVD